MLEKKKNFYPILTIAYVTFNRADLITRRIKKLLKNSLSPYVEVVVIDDNSKDNTFKKLKKLIKKNSIIKIYKNKKNLGFSGNYFEAIKRANGKYVLWASDKDGIYFNKIEKILNWILNINPDVTLLNYNRNLILKRNDPKYIRKNRTKKISFNEIWKCSHGPGIIWKRKAILQTINQWKIFDKTYPNFTKYYPNLLLLINILPKNNCFFYNGEITYQAEYPNYSHFLERENSYNFLGSRWKQHKELIDLLNNYAKKKKKYEFFYKSMINSANLNLYTFISRAIREERPDLYFYWWRGSYSPLQLIKKFFLFINLFFVKIFYEPLWTIDKIKYRLGLIFKKKI